jgi:hypothetical protein
MSFSRPYSYTLHYTSDMTHSLSIDTQMDMKALFIKGIPYSVIAKRFGVSAGVVSKYNKKWFPDGQRATGDRPAIVDETSKALVRRKILYVVNMTCSVSVTNQVNVRQCLYSACALTAL